MASSSKKFFLLDLAECHKSVSVDGLKPHAGPSVFTLATAPCRGHPPFLVAPPALPPGGGEVL